MDATWHMDMASEHRKLPRLKAQCTGLAGYSNISHDFLDMASDKRPRAPCTMQAREGRAGSAKAEGGLPASKQNAEEDRRADGGGAKKRKRHPEKPPDEEKSERTA